MPEGLRRCALKTGGILLCVLGILHLAVTPLISRFIEKNATPSAANWFRPPMLLNHVVVGILLLPLGVLTYHAASPAVDGERWAVFTVRTCAISAAVLPITLFLLMGGRYFGARPFLVAASIASVASLVLLLSAFWSHKSAP